MIGALLVAGHWFFPEHIVMWFASGSAAMDTWRAAILAGLILMAALRGYYDGVYLRMAYAVAGALLLWGGGQYFLDNPSYLFDVMYILAAGISFMVSGLQPAPDRLEMPKPVEALLPSAVMTYYSRLHKPKLQMLQSASYISRAADLNHRLTLQRRPQLLKQ